MNPEKFPAAQEHSEIERLFDDVFFVTGSFRIKGKLALKFSSNMTILRQGDSLILVNSLRLGEAGLAALEKLGKVEHVVRLAGFHGSHDPFYQHRYGAKVWSVDAPYVSGLDKAAVKRKPYFAADEILSGDNLPPLTNARWLFINSSNIGEGLLLLPQDNGVLISGDCLQNWHPSDRYFSRIAKIVMRFMGFLKPNAVGPGWLKASGVDPKELAGILALEFEHVIPAHGDPVLGSAKSKFEPAINRVASRQ